MLSNISLLRRWLTILCLAFVVSSLSGALPLLISQTAELCDDCEGEETEDSCPPLCPDCACCGLVRVAFETRPGPLPRPIESAAPPHRSYGEPPEPDGREIMHVPILLPA
jgi:hypothetical protein